MISITQNNRILIIEDDANIDASFAMIKPFEVFKRGETHIIIKDEISQKELKYSDIVFPGNVDINDLVAQLVEYNNNDHVTYALDNITINANVVNVSVAGVEQRLGDRDEVPAATDTSTSGLNGLVKRLLQKATIQIAKLDDLINGQSQSNGHLIDSVNELSEINGKVSTEVKQDAIITSLGVEGATPPTILGTGLRGFTRAIYDFITSSIYDYLEVGSANNIPFALNSEVIFDVSRYNTIGFHLTPPAGGKVLFEGTFNGINYTPVTIREIGANGYTQISMIEEDYLGSVSCLRKIKVKVIQAGVSNGTVIGKFSKYVSTIEGTEHKAAPHLYGYPVKHFDLDISGNISNISVYIPTASKKFVITHLILSADGNILVTLYDQDNLVGKRIFRGRLTSSSPFSINLSENPYPSKAINNILKVDTTNGANVNVYISGHGYEID